MNSVHLRLIAKQHEETAVLLRSLADSQDALMTANDVLNKHVMTLNLGVRERKAFVRLGINNLADLCSKSPDELLEAKNFGTFSLSIVRSKLQAIGLSLRDDVN